MHTTQHSDFPHIFIPCSTAVQINDESTYRGVIPRIVRLAETHESLRNALSDFDCTAASIETNLSQFTQEIIEKKEKILTWITDLKHRLHSEVETAMQRSYRKVLDDAYRPSAGSLEEVIWRCSQQGEARTVLSLIEARYRVNLAGIEEIFSVPLASAIPAVQNLVYESRRAAQISLCGVPYWTLGQPDGINIRLAREMMSKLLFIASVAVGFDLWQSERPDFGLFLDTNGVISALSLPKLTPLWTIPTDSPLLQSLSISSRGQPQLFPTVSGSLFALKDDKSTLQKHSESIQEITALGCSDLNPDFYLQGQRAESSIRVDWKTGKQVTRVPVTNDCTEITLIRIEHRIEIIQKDTQLPASRIELVEFLGQNCVVEGDFMSEEEKSHVKDYQLIGFVFIPQTCEETKWVLSDINTILVFVLCSLLIGFRLGANAAPKTTLRVTITEPSLSDTDPSTATTAPSFSPNNSQKIKELEAPSTQDHHKIELKIEVPDAQHFEPFELETPTSLHLPSEAQIKDLISNGRFNETFESPVLVEESIDTKVFRARHALDRKLYIVKVTKFKYEPSQKIAQIPMFREVAAMMRFRYKHIVNYVTCWVETGDSFGAVSYAPLETLCCSDGEEEPLPPPSHLSPSTNGYLYIQSEFVQGEDLKTKFTHRTQISRRENCLIFKQILKAVEHIHCKNIVHRGLKPSCIYVTADDVVKIGNFRLAAKAKARTTRQSVELSSSQYSAPELMYTAKVTKMIDIYPLGLVLLELCADTMPKECRWAVFGELREERKLPSSIQTSFPIESEIILQLTSPHPHDRPSAEKLLSSTLMRSWEHEVGLSPRSDGLSPFLSAS